MSSTQASRTAKVLGLVTLPMLMIFALKLLSIWYYTSRSYMDAHGAILAYPYDSLVFNTFDRFTDWLIPAAEAKLVNPYDLSALHALMIPAPPYGYLGLLIMKVAGILGLIATFLIIFFGYLYLNFCILRTRFSVPLLTSLNAFSALIVGCYPIYFEVDRGNIAILGAVALSALFLGFTRQMNHWVYVSLLAALACLKPAFLLFLLPVLAVANLPQILGALAIVGTNYAIPIFLPGGHPSYMIDVIQSVVAVLGPQSDFCHNASCALRAIHASPFTSLVVIIFTLPTLYIAYLIRRNQTPWQHAPLLIILITLTSLLVVDSSADYALTLVLPIFFYLLNHEMLDCDQLSLCKSSAQYLLIGFVLMMSFINIPFPNVINFAPPLRCIGILIWYTTTSRYLLQQLRLKVGTTT